MCFKKYLVLIISCVVLIPVTAVAESENINYFTFRGGVGWAQDIERTAGTKTATIEFETPYGVSAVLGKKVLPWLRLEGEFSFIDAKVDEVIGHAGQDTDEYGQDRYYSFMANAMFDYENSTNFTPFLGLGIGPVYAHHKTTFDPIINDAIPAVDSDDYTWAFGYQFMAGVGWEFMPGLSLDLMYRFFGISPRDHVQNNVFVSDVSLGSTKIHMILLGLRWAF